MWLADVHRLLLAKVTGAERLEPSQLELRDFLCFGEPGEQDQGPPPAAGAAMLELNRLGLLPGFTLVFWPALSEAGKGQPPPQPLALLAADAVLLAPRMTGGGWSGLLLAEDTAAGQVRAFSTVDGEPAGELMVPLPSDPGAVVWTEEALLLPVIP